ncbi:hypothetical protein [Streptomyces sp. NPDC002640]
MRRRPPAAGAEGHVRSGRGGSGTLQGPAADAAFGDWLTLGKDGRLSLYAPVDDGLVRWTETAVGGPDWSGPHLHPVEGMTHLTVAQGADGYVHLLGRRERVVSTGERGVEILHAIQYQTGRALTDWRSIGNPHYKHWEQGLGIGQPTGVVARDGTLHVLVRSSGGGLALRREDANGKWRLWESLRQGGGVDAMPATVALSSGRVEVGAVTDTGLAVWRQTRPGGDFEGPHTVPLHPRRGTVAALETGPDRATFFWADPATGGGTAWRPGGWPVPLGGSVPEHPYALLRTTLDGYDYVVVAHRDADGHVVLGVGATENEAHGFWWYVLPERCLGSPALAHDGEGRAVMALVGPDGRPRVARQEPGGGLTFARWDTL